MTVGFELFTERLHLRRPVEADAAAIIAIVGDWEVARRLARVPHPYNRADFRFFIEHVVPNEPTWAMVLRQSHELVGGVIGLAPHGGSQSAELGYYVGRPYWGLGLATEAARAIVRKALDVDGYAKLTQSTDLPSMSRRVRCRLLQRLLEFRDTPRDGEDGLSQLALIEPQTL